MSQVSPVETHPWEGGTTQNLVSIKVLTLNQIIVKADFDSKNYWIIFLNCVNKSRKFKKY